ncbi:hypothetical protein [Nonomuraea typhae]|uniref:hypothetical protein n=1 Tax=Nonomuraea typhae TaxID=2603600 RepID=UPI0012FCFA31|nr:hypothetical protein [Nonomuraea typhae]
MAVLSALARARTAAQWMRENKEVCTFSKTDLRAAIDAADDWLEAKLPEYNLALPAAFRSAASPDQKAWVLAFVLWRRIGRLRADEDG